MSATPTIRVTTMRRFILGKQGLWTGRRWQGKAGAAQAIRELGAVQIDPLVVVARSHDLELFSRVADYQPEQLNALLYTDRQFFDYGGALHVYPMEELPYWKLHMQRDTANERWQVFVRDNQPLLESVRAEIRARGPLGHRDLEGEAINSYRARKDSGLALYFLWRAGELMTAGRRRFDRLYDFAENVAPARYLAAASEAESEAYFFHKALRAEALARLTAWRTTFAYQIGRTVTPDEMKARIAAACESGMVATISVEGRKEVHYVLSADLPLLDALEAGNMPEAWQPLDTTSETEVNFLAPLDPVSARGRAAKLFNFDYKWEIYTPVVKRKWGYYVLPILYGHDLVARIDVKLDRPGQTMRIKGFWLEQPETGHDAAFAAALARGLIRFTRFHEVSKLDASAIQPAALRDRRRFKDSGITLVSS